MSERTAGSKSDAGDRTSPEARLQEAFSRHQGEVLGTLYHLLRNMDDARDALQEAFIKLWKHRDELPGVENVRAWIFKVAINTARDMMSTAWRRRREDLPDDGGGFAAPRHDPGDELDRHDQLERMRLAIGRLRLEEREILLLRQNGELTYEEIAAQLELPVGTVKTRMRMALARLRELLGGVAPGPGPKPGKEVAHESR
jgi:RNA polymerase sigma-70 factor (ECF subfamily)